MSLQTKCVLRHSVFNLKSVCEGGIAALLSDADRSFLLGLYVDADRLFEHDLGAINMAALNRRVERAALLRNLGSSCKALSARRDIAIRKQLLKNDKVCNNPHIYTALVV